MISHPTDCPGCYGSDRHPTCSFEQPTFRASADGEFAPPDGWAAPLAAMRAASATEPDFEDAWKERRTRELAAQRDRMTAHVDAHPSAPRLTAAEVHDNYAPPDPYSKDLDKMRSDRR